MIQGGRVTETAVEQAKIAIAHIVYHDLQDIGSRHAASSRVA